jgi:transketolase
LGAHHSPDLFHVQQELVRGPSVALASKRRYAEQAVTEAVQKVTDYAEKASNLHRAPGSDKAAELERSIKQAHHKEAATRQTLETLVTQQERVQQAIQGLSADYTIRMIWKRVLPEARRQSLPH